MDEELKALHKTDTLNLVHLPPCKSVVGCRWVYKIKTYDLLSKSKLIWLQKDIHNITVWIMRTLFLLLQK